MNYFELFEIPPGPTVDISIVSRKYLQLQKKFHPDFFTGAGELEQEDALQLSADINKAYKIFQQPVKTVEYFLQISGLLEADEKFVLPKDFLMEMMDINESLLEDPEQTTIDVLKAEEKLNTEIKNITDNYWTGNTNGESLQHLKLNYFKKKYLQRILERLAD